MQVYLVVQECDDNFYSAVNITAIYLHKEDAEQHLKDLDPEGFRGYEVIEEEVKQAYFKEEV